MMRVDKKRRCSHPAQRTVFDRGRERENITDTGSRNRVRER